MDLAFTMKAKTYATFTGTYDRADQLGKEAFEKGKEGYHLVGLTTQHDKLIAIFEKVQEEEL